MTADQPPSRRSRRRTRWIILGAAALALLAAGIYVYRGFHGVTRRYLSDGDQQLWRSDDEASVRKMVWLTPTDLGTPFNTGREEYNPCLARDGQTLYFTVGRAGQNADLWAAPRANGRWGQPAPVAELNTPDDEIGVEIAPDGQTLYFYSNRPGGLGGYDLWMARLEDNANSAASRPSTTTRPAPASPVRRWGKPVPVPGVNSAFDEYDPGLSPDGKTLFFASNRPRTPPAQPEWAGTVRALHPVRNFDIWSSAADAQGTWQAPRPFDVANSPYDEGRPVMARDGDTLYFSSNRPGGFGGFDLWRVRRLQDQWLGPANLGPQLNTAANELDPALTEEGATLVFSSDRPAARPGYHLYASRLREVYVVERTAKWDAAALLAALKGPLALILLSLVASSVVLVLMFRRWKRVDLLYRTLLVSVMLHAGVLLWSSTVQVASVVREHAARAEPTFRIENITLRRSAEGAVSGGAMPLWDRLAEMTAERSTDVALDRREASAAPAARTAVQMPKDLAPQEVEVAARPPDPRPEVAPVPELLARRPEPVSAEPEVAARLRAEEDVARKQQLAAPLAHLDRPAVFERPRQETPLAAPVPVSHAEPAPADQRPQAVSLAPKDLARPEATEVTPLAPLTATPAPLPQPTAPSAVRAEPVIAKSQDTGAAPQALERTTPIVAAPAELSRDTVDRAVRTAVRATPVPEPTTAVVGGPPAPLADPAALRDRLLVAAPPEGASRANRPQANVTDVSILAPTAGARPAADATRKTSNAPEGAVPVPPRRAAVVVAPPPAPLAGVSVAEPRLARATPGGPLTGDLTGPRALGPASPLPLARAVRDPSAVGGPGLAGSPSGAGLATRFLPPSGRPGYELRAPERREAAANVGGGTKESEAAVERALTWMAATQQADGSWLSPAGGGSALTGLALLTYLGAGYTHKDGPHATTVGRALNYYLKIAKPDGDLRAGGQMYAQGMSTIAVCEAYSLTKDPRLKPLAEKAAAFIVAARTPALGGWRYVPGQDSDTSVVGWQVMALKSAEAGGVDVPKAVYDGARRWLATVSSGPNHGLYRYQVSRPVIPSMTAEGMVCQQFMGMERDHAAMREGADYLMTNLPEWTMANKPKSLGRNYYYWYYGTLACYQMRDPYWSKWNEALRDMLVKNQVRQGPDTGSWAPDDNGYGVRGGRLFTTALATLCLEVYYRYLPLYRQAEEASASAAP